MSRTLLVLAGLLALSSAADAERNDTPRSMRQRIYRSGSVTRKNALPDPYGRGTETSVHVLRGKSVNVFRHEVELPNKTKASGERSSVVRTDGTRRSVSAATMASGERVMRQAHYLVQDAKGQPVSERTYERDDRIYGVSRSASSRTAVRTLEHGHKVRTISNRVRDFDGSGTINTTVERMNQHGDVLERSERVSKLVTTEGGVRKVVKLGEAKPTDSIIANEQQGEAPEFDVTGFLKKL